MITTHFALFVSSEAVEIDRGTARIWIRVVAAVVLAIAAAIGAALMNRVGRAMKKTAKSLNWTYRRTGTPLAVQSFAGFPLAGMASGVVDHEISGTWRGHYGKAVVLHESPPGYSAKFQVTMLALARPMPTIQIHPRSNLQRNFDLGSEVPTGVAEFDKRWRVMCADARYVRSVLTPRLMQRLLANPAAEIPVTIDGSTVYSWSPIHRAAGRNIAATLDLLADVAEMLSLGLAQVSEPGPAPSPDLAEARPPSSAVSTPKPRKNFLAVLSVILPITFLLAPLGVLLGHASLRANRRGEANNHRWAVIGLTFSYIVSVPVVGFMLLWLLLALLPGFS